MRAKLLLPWLFASAAAGGCDQPLTQVLVAVDTDLQIPTELDAVVIDVRGPDGVLRSAEGSLNDATDLPATLAIVPKGTVNGEVTVTARGMLRGSEVVARVATFSFVDEQVRVLWLDLLRSCTSVACASGETCDASGCRPTASSDELVPYDASLTRSDGGLGPDGGARDGGMRDAAVADATIPDRDAAPFDAGSDADVDGGPEDGGTADPMCTDLPNPCGSGAAGCVCDDCQCDAVCAGDCRVECFDSDRCDVNAAFTGGDYQGRCEASSCTMSARRGSNVRVVASMGATLILDCRGASNCEVDCFGGSRCGIRCQGASNCSFNTCAPGSVTSCGGGVLVCNVPCP